jgi:hypothetical protein
MAVSVDVRIEDAIIGSGGIMAAKRELINPGNDVPFVGINRASFNSSYRFTGRTPSVPGENQ